MPADFRFEAKEEILKRRCRREKDAKKVVGAAILGFTASSWLALQANSWEKVRIIVQAEIVWATLASLAQIWGILTEPLPALAWINVVLMAFFAIAFAYFYQEEERTITAQVKPAAR